MTGKIEFKELEGGANLPTHINEYISQLETENRELRKTWAELNEIVIGLNKLIIAKEYAQ